jgi:ABC-type amino acid transport substrate-binding protein
MKSVNSNNMRYLALAVILTFSFCTNITHAKESILTDEKKEWLSEHVALISFAPEKDFPPLIWSQYGEIFGLSKDYFDVIQQLIGVRFTVLEPRNLDDILQSAKSGKEISIISSRASTPDRMEYLLFTRPYFSSPSIFISNDNKELTGSEIEQKGYKVVVGNGFGIHEYLKERYPKMNLIPVENDYKVVQAVLDNKVDIGAINAVSLIYLIRENNFTNVRKVGETGFVSHFSFAVPKDMPELRNILDDAIEAIPHDFQKSVLEKWDIDSAEIQLLLNNESDLLRRSTIDKRYLTFLVVGVGLIIIILEYVFHKYVFNKKED